MGAEGRGLLVSKKGRFGRDKDQSPAVHEVEDHRAVVENDTASQWFLDELLVARTG